jgi:hypothetical protein
MLVAPSQRAASTIKASIRFVAILCEISWLPNLAPTFGLKRNPLGGEAGGPTTTQRLCSTSKLIQLTD